MTAPTRKLGPFLATMFVAGNIVGSGLFLLPTTMAALGGISIFAWALATAGALLIAGVFARLGVIAPWAGGPFAYARATMGRYFGFQTNYIYWLSGWIGNVAIALAVTGYLSSFVPWLRSPWGAAAATVVVIWAAVLVNLLGPRAVGAVETAALACGLGPVLAVGALGWIWFDPAVFSASWNVSGQTASAVIPGSLVLVFWAFLGLETAAVAAEVVDDPARNLPRATLAGVLIAALVYAGSCTVLMGIVPASELATAPAPFALVAGRMLGPVAAALVGITAIVKASGTLTGWVLVTAATAKAAADGDSFPALFAQVDRRGVPVRNLIAHGLLMSGVVCATVSPTLAQQFGRLVDVTVVLSLVIYVYSALALYRMARPGQPGGRRDRWMAILAVAFALWVILASDRVLLLVALAVMATSLPMYLIYEARRGRVRRPSQERSARIS